MKYFKPELLAHCRSRDDDVADAAAQEWAKSLADYQARIRAIRLQLPPGVRRLLSRFTLHDAKVLAIAFGHKEPRFTLLTGLEGTPSRPGEVLELSYLLVAGPNGGVRFREHAPFREGTPEWILYDEFDLDEDRAFFTHSLLLTGGPEIEVRFHHLRIRPWKEVLFSPLNLREAERTWPMVEA